jgi:hypothetical protein
MKGKYQGEGIGFSCFPGQVTEVKKKSMAVNDIRFAFLYYFRKANGIWVLLTQGRQAYHGDSLDILEAFVGTRNLRCYHPNLMVPVDEFPGQSLDIDFNSPDIRVKVRQNL